jgi:LPXTG-motif cell wall-anchored protein
LLIATDPAPTTTVVAPASDVNPAPTTTGSPTAVLGVDMDQPAPAVVHSGLLAHTGTDHTMSLSWLALSLLAAGLVLIAAFRRRIRSASSAG